MNLNNSVAVVGCGYWGKNLVRVFSQLGALKCVCDTDAARFDTLKIEGEPPRFTDSLPDVLNDETVTAVAIATPAATHHAVVRQCLEAGKDVFVEKPLALNVEQGQDLVSLARKSGRILMVGHILLYHPAVIKLRQLIQQGELGRILYCYSNRLNMGLIRTEENILWSFAPHDISVMLHLLGEEPVSAEAEGQSYLTPGVVDVTLSRLRFRSGATGHIFVSWLHPSKEQKLVVVGTEQMAVFDDTAENKLLLYPHRVDWASRMPKAVKADAVAVELEKAEPLKAECQHFLDCVADRTEPRSSGEEGLRVLKVLGDCQRSLEQAENRPAAAEKTPDREYYAHESAYVDEPCSIGKGTKIWHFSHIMKGATIGERCSVGQNVVIGSAAVVGNGVKIQNNISIYDRVTIEDGVFCGPSMVFTNVINPRSEIVRKDEYLPTLIRQGATMGANSTIVCGHTIGRYAFIAAGAVVASNVPDYALMMGVPAKQHGWMCRCAASKLDFDKNGDAACPVCGIKYRLENNEVREMCDSQ
ncbi:MAG: Gfo/Idh/MocA family oxidoreductase [Pirellulaceae bacterium]|nr:Gfo/Idh/MocA family oxidoreductase [Pirellulaceae bacterium]